MLDHGGNLQDAVRRYGRPLKDWLDLSTGINPVSYPTPALHVDAWHRLPQDSPALLDAARRYYRASDLLPVAGTQAAILALPRLRPHSRVVIGGPSYAEHAHRWLQGAHAVRQIPFADLHCAVDDCDVMVVCNPNNPTGEFIKPEVLLSWAERLAARGGWLVVDEAFADATPELSVLGRGACPSLIVLRSVGKFFGLAGLRLGFVAAEKPLLSGLVELIGPWSVSGPAQEIGTAALHDLDWQRVTRVRLMSAGRRLHELLSRHGIAANGTALFQWWPEAQAEAFSDYMAQRGIWVRLFPRAARGIRLGLPTGENGWQGLEQALAGWHAKERK
jgi:cobalamin biosynthesis protein CobC